MAWTVNLSNSQLNDLVSGALTDGSYTYQEMLDLLSTVAAGGVTASEWADLKTVYTSAQTSFASDYVKTITYNVVYGNLANDSWWGGAKTYAGVTTLGNLAANTTQANTQRLIDKWFLGLDLPMPVAGGDTATGTASTNVFSYATATGALTVNGIAASDVNQGVAGTCYYLATLGAVANIAPTTITSALIDNGNDTYGVKFYIDGVAAYTTVNKSLPTYSGGWVAFASNSSHSLAGETWVSLLEKAFVQLNTQTNVENNESAWTGENSYQAVEGGWASPIKQLTNLNYKYYTSYWQGLPDADASAELYATSPQTYKQTIINGLNAGAIGWIASWGDSVSATNGKKNFISGHAFMLLGYNSATDKFIVRNPWGGSGGYYNAEFEASITEFWNTSVKGIVAISDPTSTTPEFSYTASTAASSSTAAVTEGGTITFTITRSGSGSASTVYLSTVAGSASTTDYQALNKSALNFSAYETSKTISVSTNVDNATEGTESLGLAVFAQATDTASIATVTAYIKDAVSSNFSYTVSSSASKASNAIVEGDPVSFTLTRSGSGTASTVYLSTLAGSAGASDYVGLQKYVVNFASYETSKTVSVSTKQDGATEGNEYFSVNVYKNISDTSRTATAVGYIKDLTVPSYRYAITSDAGSPSSALKEGNTATFTITRSGAGTASTVFVSTADGSAGAADYVGVSQLPITFAANQKIATLEIALNQDWWLESDEFFSLNLYKNPGDAIYASAGSVFIKDNPIETYNYTITSNATSASPISEGEAVSFTITRSASGSASSVYLSTGSGSAGSSDFQALSKTELSFTAYETSKTITVNTYTDTLLEDDEYFWLDLYRNYADSSYAAYAAGYIKDTPVALDYTYTVTSSAKDTAVSEGGAITFTITRSTGSSASTVYWGTMAGTASAGDGDYQSLGISALSFSSYETSKTITVNTYADTQTEGDEYFWLNIYDTYNDAVDFNWKSYGISFIADPVVAPSYAYTITSNAGYASPVSEGGAVSFTITRNGTGSASSVYLSTAAGSAGDNDFGSINKTELSFDANETSKVITVNTYTDSLTESDEYFWLNLYQNYADSTYASTAIAYLKDQPTVTDFSYAISSSAQNIAVSEGGTVTFTITRSGSGAASTIYLSTYVGTAGVSDYESVNATALSFGADETSKTVTVNTYTDTLIEEVEYFYLETFKTYADAIAYRWDAYGWALIKDAVAEKTYSYVVTSNTSFATPESEGNAVTFTITRSGSGSASTIYLATSDGSTSAGDYEALPLSSLTFSAEETSKTVTVNTYSDSLVEETEYFWLDVYQTYDDATTLNWESYSKAVISDATAVGVTRLGNASTDKSLPKFAIAQPGLAGSAAAATGIVSATIRQQSFPGRSVGEFNNEFAFAALKSDGSVVTWGYAENGGDLSSTGSALDGSIDVHHIYSSNAAFAALRADGSVVSWGNASAGGDSSAVALALNGTVDVSAMASTAAAFAAIRTDGSVVTWGDPNNGGDSSTVSSKLNGNVAVDALYSTMSAFAARRADGSVVTWGFDLFGGNSDAIATQLAGSVAVIDVVATGSAFAALRADGSVVSWGSALDGGDSTAVAGSIAGTLDVTALQATTSAFAALRADGSVVTWGDLQNGGDSSTVASKLNGTNDVIELASTQSAFAARRADGSVVSWGHANSGGDSTSVAAELSGVIDVRLIAANALAFAALRSDGSVVSWGYEAYGGDQSAVDSALDGTVAVQSIVANDHAFAAIRADGSVVTWGSLLEGGDSSNVTTMIDGTIDVTQVYATGTAFTALRTDGSVVTWGNLDKGGDNTAVASALTSVSNLSGDLLNAWTVTTISVIDGSAANDIFNNSVADESIDGGAGIDTLVFSDARANYTLTQNASGWSVDSTAGGTDTIDNVERLQFSDISLALDVDAVSGQAYRIYRAALGRKPDDSGLGYWIAMMDQGMDIVEVSARFIDSDEFRATYGTNPSDREFITNVYLNVLDRTPDEAGYAWWIAELNNNPDKTKQKVLADFAESDENINATATLIGTGIEYTAYTG